MSHRILVCLAEVHTAIGMLDQVKEFNCEGLGATDGYD